MSKTSLFDPNYKMDKNGNMFLKKLSPTNLWNANKETFKRFPLPLSCAYAVAIIALLYISFEDALDVWIIHKSTLVIFLAMFWYSALSVFNENKEHNQKVLGQGLLTGALILYYHFGLPADENLSGSSWIFQYIFLIFTGLISLSWLAFNLKGKTENLKIWEYNRQVWTNLLITIFFGLILFLGVSAGILAIDNLFGVDIDEKWYLRTLVFVTLLFGPSFFLYHFPKNDKTLKIPKQVPHFVNVLAKYILAPLVVGYFLILYTYTGNIIITWDWPKNLVSWLVIGFLAVGIFTYALWTPFFEGKVEKYRRLFWVAFIPQVWVLFCAIGIRIMQYSWTENRYTVVMFGVWLMLIALYFIFDKKAQLKYLLASISIVVLGTQFGPWSIYEVSKRAQTERLQGYLTQYDITGKITKEESAKIPFEDQKEISSIVRYLNDRHGRDAALAALPVDQNKFKSDDYSQWEIPETLLESVGLRYISRWENSSDGYFNLSPAYNAPRDISGYDLQIRSNIYNDNYKTNETWAILLNQEDQKISIYEGSTLLGEFDVSEKLEQMKSDFQDYPNEDILFKTKETVSSGNNINPEAMSEIYENDQIKLKVYFTNLSGRNNKIDYFYVEVFATKK